SKALDKNPDKRYQTISEVVVDLRSAATEIDETATRRFAALPGRRALMLGAATAAVAAAILLRIPLKQTSAPWSNYAQITHFPDSVVQPTISPNGSMVAFIRGSSRFYGPGEIYVKSVTGGEPVQLTHDGLSKTGPI